MSNINIPKQPIIRPGQRKPCVKGTRLQIYERRIFVERLLRAGKSKTQIHRAVRKNSTWNGVSVIVISHHSPQSRHNVACLS
jgi:hypothetical protein